MAKRKNNKILILANSSSGLLEFRGELISALKDRGYEVAASLPETEEKKRLEELGCKVIHTPFARKGMNPFKDLALLNTYRSLIRREAPLAVLTYTIKPNIYGGMASAGLKVPCFANITGLGSALENSGPLGKLATFLYREGLKKDAVVFVQNASNRDFVLKKRLAAPEQVVLLPGSGVNLSHFAVKEMPEKSGFLFVSRVMKEKGIEEFLKAAQNLKKEDPGIGFTVLGACEEDYTERLKRLKEQGIIEYPGKVPDTRPYLDKAQCQVHPSFYSEGMSNVCLEAAASGRAVITTDHPGCRETVKDKETGYLVKPRDAESLEKAMRSFLALSQEDKSAMGLAGRKYMEERFDRNIVVTAYMERIAMYG